MRKGRVYDLGYSLCKKEVNEIFKNIKSQISNNQSVDLNEIVTGGSKLLSLEDKSTKMNLIQFACWCSPNEKDEPIFHIGEKLSQLFAGI